MLFVACRGGADSDIVMDLCERVSPHQVKYVWFDTGIEYHATKEHLEYLENHYGVKIERVKASIPVPLGNKKWGQPFLSKQVSENIYRLQKHDFKWEDKSFDELYSEYPKCKSALKWWCNETGDGSFFGINRNSWLKEFMLLNPPQFKISQRCCEGAKKNPSYEYAKINNVDLIITGIRRSEGGQRTTAYKGDFGVSHSINQFRPIFSFNDSDKNEYEQKFNVIHSKCYTEYGLKRTGCAGCPFGRDCESEFEIAEKFEPRLYKAINNIFSDSREYTRKYREFQKAMKLKFGKNKKCCKCGSLIVEDDVIPMNLKYYGRNINQFECKACFMSVNNMSEEDWEDAIEGFKSRGCELF